MVSGPFAPSNGGVAIAAKGAMADSSVDDPAVAHLLTTAKWKEAYIPCPVPTTKRARRVTTCGIFVASLYTKAGEDNAGLFRQTLAAASRIGSAPYFISI